MNLKKFLCLAIGSLALLLFVVRAESGSAIAKAGQPAAPTVGRAAANSVVDYYPDVPQITPTPALPDYVPYIAWDTSYPCPYPVLQVGSRNQGAAMCWSVGMEVDNSSGQSMYFTFPNESFGYVTYPCQVGPCMPFSWLSSMPFTATIDYNNTLQETNEENNTIVFTTPPPQSPNCGITTGTPTPTTMPSSTPTATHTPAFPDLVGYAQWVTVPDCPGFALEMRTQTYGDTCSYAGPSHSRLQNSRGETLVIPVHALQAPYRVYDYDCPMGSCLPESWLTAMPFTMTVDVYNEVWESAGENNNVTTFNIPPPPSPCGTDTPTATPTATPTCSANVPDLEAQAYWTLECSVNGGILHASTHNLAAPVPATTMRIEEGNGGYTDYPVPPLLSGQTYTVDKPYYNLGSPPITVTVDYANVVVECREDNNTFVVTYTPPTTTRCPTNTPSTNTPVITNTPARTLTPTFTSTFTPASSSTSTPTQQTGSATPTPCVMMFSDVNPGDYFYEDVQGLYCLGAVTGYADGTFRPFNNTTRGQVCKIVVLALHIPVDTRGGPHFTDVLPGSPFYEYVETAYNRGIVSGYADGTFRSNNFVTRAQLVKIICRALGWPLLDPPGAAFSDVPRGSAFYTYIETAVCHGVISGYSDSTFRPNNNATRAQVSKIIVRAVLDPEPCGTPTPTR